MPRRNISEENVSGTVAACYIVRTHDHPLVAMQRKLNRPHVSINMAMSADGKVSTYKRETFSLGSAKDRYLMDVLRAKSDAVVIGARTLQLDGWAIRIRYAEIQKKRIEKGLTPHPLNVVLSTDLDLPAKREFFTHRETGKLIITTRSASATRVRRFEKLAEVAVLPRKRIRPQDALDVLSKRGAKRVLVEGGGPLNYAFFKANLVDEIYITVTPRILGGTDAPTVADGKGFLLDTHPRLELVSSRRSGDEVFLRYRVAKR
ncbi:MAG: dihydrofolate reductase family protein [Candidatus Latescibacterota bacterium]|nr:MAG: dihydrofolate reductase family protein [Candidatus Latescibacterota bacterium]